MTVLLRFALFLDGRSEATNPFSVSVIEGVSEPSATRLRFETRRRGGIGSGVWHCIFHDVKARRSNVNW